MHEVGGHKEQEPREHWVSVVREVRIDFYVARDVYDRVHFFFFQAEDGIRDYKVTGVQTCALPISRPGLASRPGWQTRAHPGQPGFRPVRRGPGPGAPGRPVARPRAAPHRRPAARDRKSVV